MDANFTLSGNGACLYHHSLLTHKRIVHGFSLRTDPVSAQEKSYGLNGYQSELQVLENRQQFVKSLSLQCPPSPNAHLRLVTLKQVHSDKALVAEDLHSGEIVCSGDALLTGRPGLLLAVQTADCMPLLILDPENGAVAAIHAGWRGTVKRIIEKSVRRLQERFGTDPTHCIAVLGPSIRSCCYVVGQEVVSAFHSEFPYASRLFHPLGKKSRPTGSQPTMGDGLFLDLPSACRRQLLDSGMRETCVFTNPPCTSCDTSRFYSHRAEAGHCGRMMAVIGILPIRNL